MYDTDKVRALNDAFRSTLQGGRVMVTRGVLALDGLSTILAKVRDFTEFSSENDPHSEHDFGGILHDGQQLFWKLDYYDPDLQMGSPDPADPAVTARVMTIMMADEY